MSDHVTGESGEELIDEEGRNATQQRIDSEGGGGETPVDAPWTGNDADAVDQDGESGDLTA